MRIVIYDRIAGLILQLFISRPCYLW